MDVVSRLRTRRGDVLDAERAVGRRPASIRDDRFLRDLLADPRDRDLLMPIDVREMLCDLRFRDQRRTLAAAHPGATSYILIAQGIDVGRVVIDEGPNGVHVVDITVHRNHRRRAIASAALRQLVDRDRPVTLTLRPDDQPMLALCRQLGFVAIPDAERDSTVTLHHRAPASSSV